MSARVKIKSIKIKETKMRKTVSGAILKGRTSLREMKSSNMLRNMSENNYRIMKARAKVLAQLSTSQEK